MTGAVPVLGACLMTEAIPDHIAWLRDMERDVEVQDFFRPDVLAGDWQGVADRARRLLDGHRGRRAIHGPFVGLPLAAGDPDIRSVVRDRLLTGLRAAERLGADQMVIHSPFTAWDSANRPAHAREADRVVGAIRDVLDPVLARAGTAGVTLVLENIEDVEPGMRAELADRMAHPALKLSVDTGHAQLAHASGKAPPVDYFILDAGARLDHVHLQDVDNHADRHWPPGMGVIVWDAVFRALAHLPAMPRLHLEMRDPADIPVGAAWLTERGLAR